MTWILTFMREENLASAKPAIVQKMIHYMEEAHKPHPNWPTPRKDRNYFLSHGIKLPSLIPWIIFFIRRTEGCQCPLPVSFLIESKEIRR